MELNKKYKIIKINTDAIYIDTLDDINADGKYNPLDLDGYKCDVSYIYIKSR